MECRKIDDELKWINNSFPAYNFRNPCGGKYG
jgi:hypothetical protein